MIKLNNKGMTIVEILVCFILVTFITVSLFTTVSSFNNKRSIESVKSDLLQYRNDIDKMLEDDLIHKGLTDAKVKVNTVNNNTTTYGATLYFRDGSYKKLIIYSQRAGEYCTDDSNCEVDAACTGASDDFYIAYGNATNSDPGVLFANSDNYLKYSLPRVGEFVNDMCTPDAETIQDLRFGNIKISNEQNVLLIYINFEHPELGNNYSINIVAPINYFA